jgi:thiosulfate/3-mercaptopyruvate sulfurtransferase
MNRWLLHGAMVAVLSLAAAAASAQAIVDLDYVRQAVSRGALLWDARDEDAFAKGHIPGAVNLGDPTLTLRDTLTEDYLPTADIEKALGAAGIDPAREIIVYGDRGLPSVYFAQLTLRQFGAANARVFHDGIEAWRAAGLAVSSKAVRPKPVAVKLAVQPGVIVPTREVVAALKRSDVQFLDVRTPKEFRGEDIRAIRGGHIPGAINIPFEQNWVDPEARAKLRAGKVKDSGGMALKPRAELAKLYEKLDPAKEVIVYCQSGNRAAQSAAVLGDLGFRNVKVFDSSWLGYASWLSAPAEDEVWTNFGALLTAVKGLENRFGELQRQAPGKSAK